MYHTWLKLIDNPTVQVQLLKSLNHPNILQFIGILVREGKNLVLITEYADGGTLRKTIKNVVSEQVLVYYVLKSLTTFVCLILR